MTNIRTAMNYGAFDFLTKPIDFEDLEITIRKTLKHQETLRTAIEAHARLESIEHELALASMLQETILPSRFPQGERFDLHACMTAAREVGGDFYDVFALSGGLLGLVVADVSGKGIPASLFMVLSRTLLKGLALGHESPAICLSETNSQLVQDNKASMFVTVFYAIYDPAIGLLRYANAGHNPPMLLHADGRVEEIATPGELVLGMFEDVEFSEHRLSLKPGDTLFAYTDGVTEAFDAKRRQFGLSRLHELLSGMPSLPVADLNARILEQVKAFAGDEPQADDITCLSLRYRQQE